MTPYYFDYNATTPLDPEVFEAMKPFFTDQFGNPSSLHQLGQVPARAVREARRRVALLLGAEESEIFFTSGGTESNNTALRSALALSGKKEIVASSVEHSSVLKLCRELADEGYRVREIGVDSEGRLDLEALENSLTNETAVVSLMLANNETGVLFPVEEAGKIIAGRGIFFHVDAVQAAGKFPLQMKESSIDFLSVSAHKLYGPKGTGALYIRKGTALKPLMWGGSQERGRRAGTENVPGIAGFGAASEKARRELAAEISRLRKLRDGFEEAVLTEIPGTRINGGGTERLANTSNLRFDRMEAEILLLALDEKGICVSAGSACMSGAHEPSHVLKAMGLSEDEANASLRFSFGRFTAAADVRHLIQVLRETVLQLRSFPAAAAG